MGSKLGMYLRAESRTQAWCALVTMTVSASPLAAVSIDSTAAAKSSMRYLGTRPDLTAVVHMSVSSQSSTMTLRSGTGGGAGGALPGEAVLNSSSTAGTGRLENRFAIAERNGKRILQTA